MLLGRLLEDIIYSHYIMLLGRLLVDIIYSHYMMLLGRNILHTYISTVSMHKKLIEINPNNYKVSINYLSKYVIALLSLLFDNMHNHSIT